MFAKKDLLPAAILSFNSSSIKLSAFIIVLRYFAEFTPSICCVETIHHNRGVLCLDVCSYWSQLTLLSYMSLAFGPLCHNDIIASHKSFVPFDTDKVSTMGANSLQVGVGSLLM